MFHSSNSAILFVSHGDPLQILQAVLNGVSENSSFFEAVADLKTSDNIVSSLLSQHRKFALLTGELRRVVWIPFGFVYHYQITAHRIVDLDQQVVLATTGLINRKDHLLIVESYVNAFISTLYNWNTTGFFIHYYNDAGTLL
jgi:hypothetical protein